MKFDINLGGKGRVDCHGKLCAKLNNIQTEAFVPRYQSDPTRAYIVDFEFHITKGPI